MGSNSFHFGLPSQQGLTPKEKKMLPRSNFSPLRVDLISELFRSAGR